MAKFTPKQMAFVEAMARGATQADAAMAAGYLGSSARVTVSQLMKRTDIKAAIKAARVRLPAAQQDTAADELAKGALKMQAERYDDPIAFLTDVMNHPKLGITSRLRAAEVLMPYKHARIGEKGKKEKQGDAAGEVARKSKFRPQAAPSNVVKLHG